MLAIQLLEFLIESMGYQAERSCEKPLLRACSTGSSGAFDAPGGPELLARARHLALQGEVEASLRLLCSLLQMEPENCAAMDAAGELMAAAGDVRPARELLLRSAQLCPDQGAAKYVVLGHLSHGEEAAEFFNRALTVLAHAQEEVAAAAEGNGPNMGADGSLGRERGAAWPTQRAEVVDDESDGGESEEEDEEYEMDEEALERMAEEEEAAKRERAGALHRRKRRLEVEMSRTLSALAKVYLTELFHDGASASRVEQLLDRALLLHADNAEALQALADLRFFQERKGEALALLKSTMQVCARELAALPPSAKLGGGRQGRWRMPSKPPRSRRPSREGADGAPVSTSGRESPPPRASLLDGDLEALSLGLGFGLLWEPHTSFPFQLVTARLLVELCQHRVAAELLEQLLARAQEQGAGHDAEVETRFLLGLCLLMEGQGGAAREVLGRAKRLLEQNQGSGQHRYVVPSQEGGSPTHPNGDGCGSLLGTINALMTRRRLTEEERALFWNPRLWGSGGLADDNDSSCNVGDSSCSKAGAARARGGTPSSGAGSVRYLMDPAATEGASLHEGSAPRLPV
eukprot:jgi/Mesvir1/25434/Mv01711-RA.1